MWGLPQVSPVAGPARLLETHHEMRAQRIEVQVGQQMPPMLRTVKRFSAPIVRLVMPLIRN
jgi:hypothetical protein